MAINNYIANPIFFKNQDDVVRVVDEYRPRKPVEYVCGSKLVVATDLMRGMGYNNPSTFESFCATLKIKPVTMYVRHYQHNGHPYKNKCITFDDAEKLVRCKCTNEKFKKWFIESVLGRAYEQEKISKPIPVIAEEKVKPVVATQSTENYIAAIDKMIVELVTLKQSLSSVLSAS